MTRVRGAGMTTGRLGRLTAFAFILCCSAASAGAGPSKVVIPGDHVFPESITSAGDGTLYIGSLGEGMVFHAAPGTAEAEPFIPKGDGLMSVLGVLADEGSGTLWACSSDLGPMGVHVTERGGPPTLHAFDLRSGKLKSSCPFPGGSGFCNDLVIAKDGTAYVTDTTNPRILRLRPGARELEVWLYDPVFGTKGAMLDGIALGNDGGLYVDTYEDFKLFHVSLKPDGGPGKVK